MTTTATSADFPKVNVYNIRRVFSTGDVLGRPDIIRYRNRYYLTFTSCSERFYPEGVDPRGISPRTFVNILVSDDLTSWREVHRFRVPKRWPNFPLLVEFNNQLLVYMETFYTGESKVRSGDAWRRKNLLCYAARSADGKNWTSPVALNGTFAHELTEVRMFNGKVYAGAKRWNENNSMDRVILESDDGLSWRHHAFVPQVTRGGASNLSFQFEDDGAIQAVYIAGYEPAVLVLHASAPYVNWTETARLEREIKSPPIITRWGKRYVVGLIQSVGDHRSRTTLNWLEDREVRGFLNLGGAVYGFVELTPTRAVVAWESSRDELDERRSAGGIYLADLAFVDDYEHP